MEPPSVASASACAAALRRPSTVVNHIEIVQPKGPLAILDFGNDGDEARYTGCRDAAIARELDHRSDQPVDFGLPFMNREIAPDAGALAFMPIPVLVLPFPRGIDGGLAQRSAWPEHYWIEPIKGLQMYVLRVGHCDNFAGEPAEKVAITRDHI